MVRAGVVVLLLALWPAVAHAKRVALVVGINKYDNLPRDRQLAKAVNDARAMEVALKAVGFDVIKAEDVGRPAFNQAWQQLLNKVSPGDEVAVFFSGHGVEIEGVNYLIPRDVPAVGSGETRRLKNESLSFDEIRRDLAAHGPKLSLFIIDACRDNPFTDARGRSIGGSKGLVPVQAEQGSFIMFAAGAREMALDRLSDTDGDPNSVYTRKLLPLLKQPGLHLPVVAQRVRREVSQLANTVGHRQSPAYYDEGADDVCLAGCAKPQRPEVSDAERHWENIKDTKSIGELEAYIRRYHGTFHGDLAKVRLDELKQVLETSGFVHTPQEVIEMQIPSGKRIRLGGRIVERSLKRGANLHTEFAITDDVKTIVVNYTGLLPNIREGGGVIADGKLDGGGRFIAETLLEQAENYMPSRPAVSVGPPPPTSCDGVNALVGNPIDYFPDQKCLKPKDTFKDCWECPEMVVVPAGEFMMGSEEKPDEKPVHKVTIPKPFAVGKFEVTVGEYLACVAAAACQAPHWNEPGSEYNISTGSVDHYKKLGQALSHPRHPIVGVSWDNATRYASWLSAQTSKTYRLLTEAEWEYAARAGSRGKYTWGDAIAKNRANCDGCGSQWDNKQTAPVGSFQANAFGLHDMHGNVLEWVADCYKYSYENAPSDGRAASDVAGCSRVMRGGSWRSNPTSLRSALRVEFSPVYRDNYVGFRLARTLSP